LLTFYFKMFIATKPGIGALKSKSRTPMRTRSITVAQHAVTTQAWNDTIKYMVHLYINKVVKDENSCYKYAILKIIYKSE